MTAREAINAFCDAYPTSLGEDVLISWLNELEGAVYEELILTHEGERSPFVPLAPGGLSRKLYLPEPYSKVYLDYLRMKSDIAHSDTRRYDSSSAYFAASWSDAANHYNRTHKPLGAGELITKKAGE